MKAPRLRPCGETCLRAEALSAFVATPGLRSHFGGGGSAKEARRRLGVGGEVDNRKLLATHSPHHIYPASENENFITAY
ncbi:MAG: hypothetical protein IH977_05315 [Nitrospinae bacterium]|nr:hypothetical protein [Nitrospinota bacterium]